MKDEAEFFLGHEIDKLKYDKSPELFPDYWRDLYRKLAPFLNIISNDPAIVSTQEELKQVKESKDFIATNLATQNKMLESQLREMKTSNEKKINAMAEAIGLLTGGLFPHQLTIAEEFVVPDDLKEIVLEQRRKSANDHPLLKAEIRADMEREAREKEAIEKKRKENDFREKARLRLEQVIKELQS